MNRSLNLGLLVLRLLGLLPLRPSRVPTELRTLTEWQFVYKLNFGHVSTTNQTKPARGGRCARAGCMRRYRRGELVVVAYADTGAASWL
jgi:hypothetical protein